MPELISKDEARKIVETRQPVGKFFYPLNGNFIALDNTTYDAWIEEFDTMSECLAWLRR